MKHQKNKNTICPQKHICIITICKSSLTKFNKSNPLGHYREQKYVSNTTSDVSTPTRAHDIDTPYIYSGEVKKIEA
jgi:hypothetical protein